MVTRRVVVQLWCGPRTVRRLRFPAADQPAYVDTMSDADVASNLRRLGVQMPALASAEDHRTRLRDWPTQSDLDAIATAWTAANDGVRPNVRVLEHSGLPFRRGPAGSVP